MYVVLYNKHVTNMDARGNLSTCDKMTWDYYDDLEQAYAVSKEYKGLLLKTVDVEVTEAEDAKD